MLTVLSLQTVVVKVLDPITLVLYWTKAAEIGCLQLIICPCHSVIEKQVQVITDVVLSPAIIQPVYAAVSPLSTVKYNKNH
jgi:hypothetical protein